MPSGSAWRWQWKPRHEKESSPLRTVFWYAAGSGFAESKTKLSYSWRSASMGFKLAAFTEGSSPKMMPMIMENSTDKR